MDDATTTRRGRSTGLSGTARRLAAGFLAVAALSAVLVGQAPQASAWTPPEDRVDDFEAVPYTITHHASDVTTGDRRRCESYWFVTFDENWAARSGAFTLEDGWLEESVNYTVLRSNLRSTSWPNVQQVNRSTTIDGQTFEFGPGLLGFAKAAYRWEGPLSDPNNVTYCETNIPRFDGYEVQDQADGQLQLWLIVNEFNERPTANFDADPSGTSVQFTSTSTSPSFPADQIAHLWDFGDGTTGRGVTPQHTYAEPGTYTVQLVVQTPGGRSDSITHQVTVAPALSVSVSAPNANQKRGTEVPVRMTITNSSDQEATSLQLLDGVGIRFDEEYLSLVSGPTPAAPSSLGAGQSVTLEYIVTPQRTGAIQITGGASASIDGNDVDAEGLARMTVLPAISMDLTTTVTTATRKGDEFQAIATLHNDEVVPIGGVTAEPLIIAPDGVASPAGGPLGPGGGDPRVSPVTVPAGGSVAITWTLTAEEAGTADLTAYVSGTDPFEGNRFTLSDTAAVAIEAPAIELSDVRRQPGHPVPGDFGTVRGTVTNVGTGSVDHIGFTIEGSPEVQVIQRLLNENSPELAAGTLALDEGESYDFLIPVGMVSDSGDLTEYTIDLSMSGKGTVGGVPVVVSDDEHLDDALDLTPYWTSIIDSVRRQLLQSTLDFFEGVNEWGDSSTLGGIAVGSTQGAIAALQKMGDGLLKVNDLLGEVSGDGGQRLTDEAEAIVAAAREYYHTTSAKKMAIDFANVRDDITVGGVGVFADYLHDLDKAYTARDVRKVAELIAEPATEIAVGFGAEKAGGQLLANLAAKPIVRDTIAILKRAPDDIDELAGEVPWDRVVARELEDIKDLPTGVPITGETVARAGVTAEEHAWMIEMSKEHGVAFFVRPRPEDAAKWAKLGYNAKPMAIKLKSVNDIDALWLGFEDYAEKHGLVVLREPKDPYPAMFEAVERGDLEWGGKEVDDIIERYNLRRAEWESRDALIDKLNSGDGFEIQRYGKTIKTKVKIDGDGLLRFTYNDKPVYSDIDLLSIAYPDGTPIPPELHQKIARAGGFGFDAQHGDSVMTSDFPNWDTAKKFAVKYAEEHMRGGDPLVIVQPDATTLGYVQSLDVPSGDLPGSGYDLFGVIRTTYEGAGRH